MSVSNLELSTWNCLSEINRTKLFYVNNPTKEVEWNLEQDGFTSIRFEQGAWDSQWAIQYLSALVIKEIMGVPVSFYPNLQQTYSDYAGNPYNYPDYQWMWLKDDDVDFLFEAWPVAIDDTATSYFKSGEVINGGFTGVYGDIGWFVPKYVTDEHPEARLPELLQSITTGGNSVFRTRFLNDSQYGFSGNNWTLEHQTVVNDAGGISSWTYDVADNIKPCIWGSAFSYAMSVKSKQIVDNLFNGSFEWNFCAWNSESKLTSMMTDLYKNNKWFIANLYSPHTDFAKIIDSSSGTIMEFERISLSRNPSMSATEPCYIQGLCDFGLETLLKFANPKLNIRIPEMIKFFNTFDVSSTDITNIILLKQNKIKDNATNNWAETMDDIWTNTTCDWLKNNYDKALEWKIEINKNDYLNYQFPKNTQISIIIINIIIFIIACFAMFWIFKKKHYESIKIISVNVLTFFTLGLCLSLISGILYTFHPITNNICCLYHIFYGLGSILIVASPALKAFRINLLKEKNAKSTKKATINDLLSENKLIKKYLSKVILIEIIILIIYLITFLNDGGIHKKIDDEEYQIIYHCYQESGLTNYILILNQIYQFIILMGFVYFSFQTRESKHMFPESTRSYFGAFISLFITIITILFGLAADDKTMIIFVKIFNNTLIIIILSVLFLGVPIFNYYANPDQRNIGLQDFDKSQRPSMSSISYQQQKTNASMPSIDINV